MVTSPVFGPQRAASERYGVFARFEKLAMGCAAVLVWGGGALSLGVRTVPKGPIDRANKVSSPSLPPSRYSNTPRFERVTRALARSRPERLGALAAVAL